MHIHFICSGNAYRSRLAEAYAKSINTSKNVKFSSSGIQASKTKKENGPICWYAMLISKRNNLVPYLSWSQKQTTQKILKNVDLVVCMNQKHLDYCNNLGWNKKFEVWNIPDLNESPQFIPEDVDGIKTDINHIELSNETYANIVKKVDNLVTRLELFYSKSKAVN